MASLPKYLQKRASYVEQALLQLAQRDSARAMRLDDKLNELTDNPRPAGSFFREHIKNTNWERRGYHIYGFIIAYMVRDTSFEIAILGMMEENEDAEF